MQNQYLAEHSVLKQGVLPADLNGAGATGERINLDVSSRLAIVVAMGDSTGATASFTLRQHDAASAGNSKDLEVSNNYYHKAGAATSFTKVEVSTDTAAYDLSAIFAAEEGIVVFEVLGEDLDVENGFDHVSIDIADPTAAKVIGVMYHGHAPFKKPAYEVEA